MADLKRFAIDNNVSVHLVAHQTTPRRDETGRYQNQMLIMLRVVVSLPTNVTI